MILVLEVITIFFAAVAMSLALAHALEFPGKMRLNPDTYMAIQTIYYPGFTIGGIGEPLAIIGSFTLLIAMRDERSFAWIAVGLVALVAMHAVFWFVTQPTNRFWLRNQQMANAGSKFFGTERSSGPHSQEKPVTDFTSMRNRWEYSHIARAFLSIVALIVLVIALAESRS
ncbi:MAG: DUF1772 domain-containing protein [Acidobacteria bacterium]|nr:DUF1772 domain-containing protein [Acidobacteriota bacterium]